MSTGEIVIEETRRKGEELRVEWRVSRFFSLSGYWGDSYESPLFCFGDGCWLFRMCPNVWTRNPASDRMMALYLVRKDSGPPRTVLFTFGIKGLDGVEKKRTAQREFSVSGISYGFDEIWSRFDLKERESRLMPNDVLTITCDLKRVQKPCADGGAFFQDASIQTDGEFREPDAGTDGSQSLDKLGTEKVVEDIGKLLVSGAISDITVRLGDFEVNVNRDILLDRSPALSAVFQNERAWQTSNRISISEPGVFKEFLHYMYKESVQFLTEQNVLDLYRVADKYLADDLKLQCLAYIRDKLSVETFCDTVQLALSLGDSNLLKLAVDFGTKNIQSIICSVEWRNFNHEYPTEANEILVKCICPQI